MRCSLFALPIFGICLVIQLSNSQIICNKNDYTVVYSNGTFKRCLSCGKCHEGYGLYPPCGSKLFHPPISECRSCKAQTFSSEYDSSSCKACHHCAEHEIKEAECTNKNDTACSGKCKQGYFMSKTVHNCQECSACCSDGKDEKIKECVGLGIKNKECSPRPDKTCAGQPPTTDATKGSGGLATKYLIIIIVSTIIVAIAVVIMIVMVCLRRKRNRESSVRDPEAPAVKERNGSASIIASQGYASDVGPQAHQLQQLQVPVSITERNSAWNPTYQGTPTQQLKNNPKLTTASQDYATHLGPQTQQSRMTVPVIAHSLSNPTYQGTPTPQPKNNPKPTAATQETLKSKDSNSNDEKPSVSRQASQDSQTSATQETLKSKDSNSNDEKPSVSRQASQDSQTSGEYRRRSISSRSLGKVCEKLSSKKDILLVENEEGHEKHDSLTIEEHPTDQEGKEGTKVQFRCKAKGKRKITYQWLKDGVTLSGQKSSDLVLDQVKPRDFGCYSCEVRCSDGQNKSKTVKLSDVAKLDVSPREGMRFKYLTEAFREKPDIQDDVGKQLQMTVTGAGGWKKVAHKYNMREVDINNLERSQKAGEDVIAYLKSARPDLTVYEFCKSLKDIHRNDIIKSLSDQFFCNV